MKGIVILCFWMSIFDVPLVVVVLSNHTSEFIKKRAAVLNAWKQVELFLDPRENRANRSGSVHGPFPENAILNRVAFGG